MMDMDIYGCIIGVGMSEFEWDLVSKVKSRARSFGVLEAATQIDRTWRPLRAYKSILRKFNSRNIQYRDMEFY